MQMGTLRSRRPQPRPARGTRLVLEQLEDRSLPSSYSAASVSALIADITAANTAGGANTITLTAPTTSPYVLTGVNNTTYGNTGLPVIAGQRLASGANANDNLSIVGNGDTIERSTASGTPDFRLLAVGGGASLTLANLTLQNGVSTSGTYGGGAIYQHGAALTLSGVTVQNNSDFAPGNVEGLGGGAIYAAYGSLTLQNGTVLEGNEAYGEYAFGGAVVLVTKGTVNITNSTFTGNTAGGEDCAAGCGGALYVDNGGESDALLTNTTLTNNNVTGGEGGEGGGVCVADGWVTLSNCTVESNTANAEGGGVYDGRPPGNVSFPPGDVSLSNCTLESNSAVYGGGLYVAGGATLSSCALESNSAVYGGGLYATGAGIVTLSSCTVASNSANYGGGLYAFTGGTVTLSSCTVESNSALSGGGLNINSGTVTLTNCTVVSNSATVSGGGIYVASGNALRDTLSAPTVYLDPFTVANTINNTDSTGLNGSTANIDGTYILT